MKAREAADGFISLVLAGAAIGSWAHMVCAGGREQLSARGIGSLKYFTVLSNLFFGVTASVMAIRQFCRRPVTDRLLRVKLAAVTAVGLTFSVVVAFLGPMYGYPAMLAAENLWLHLIVPVAAMLQFVILEADRTIPLSWTGTAVLPALFYGIGYYTNVIVNGRGTPPHMNDFYGFASWGIRAAAGVFGIIIAATWGIAAALRAGNQAVMRRRERRTAVRAARATA